uniref:TFIIS N-terminal domain-containing protein n=1 Tax=Acrobeloides nanus TaxID=290746 RepID=A0A914DP17_9BILA
MADSFAVQDDDLDSNHSFDPALDFTAVRDNDDEDDFGLDSQAISSKPDLQEPDTKETSEDNNGNSNDQDGSAQNDADTIDQNGDNEAKEDRQSDSQLNQSEKLQEIDSDIDDKNETSEKIDEQPDSDDESPKVRKRRLVFSSDEEDGEGNREEKEGKNEDQEDNEGDREEKGENDDQDPAENEGAKKRTNEIFGSDSDSDADEADNEKRESTLMTDIFGDDSDAEIDAKPEGEQEESGALGEAKLPDSDDDEPKFLRVEEDSDVERQESDFDLMMQKKRAEKKKRRKKDGSIDLISDADDQIKALVDSMIAAANDDRNANAERRPAIQKRKMLPVVKNALLKADFFDALLDNGMMSAVSEWLAPLPDKSLPALEIRSMLLKILSGFPTLEQGILKQSGLGKAVMFLFKHPKETRENKNIAAKLIREWARPIFQLDSDYSSLSREERIQRDYEHMPPSKRQKLVLQEDGTVSQSPEKRALTSKAEEEPVLRPGDQGFIPRARVPRPSTRDYVIRPKPKVEARYKGETKSRANSKLEKTTREFQARNKAMKVKRAIGVSIEGRRMEL